MPDVDFDDWSVRRLWDSVDRATTRLLRMATFFTPLLFDVQTIYFSYAVAQLHFAREESVLVLLSAARLVAVCCDPRLYEGAYFRREPELIRASLGLQALVSVALAGILVAVAPVAGASGLWLLTGLMFSVVFMPVRGAFSYFLVAAPRSRSHAVAMLVLQYVAIALGCAVCFLQLHAANALAGRLLQPAEIGSLASMAAVLAIAALEGWECRASLPRGRMLIGELLKSLGVILSSNLRKEGLAFVSALVVPAMSYAVRLASSLFGLIGNVVGYLRIAVARHSKSNADSVHAELTSAPMVRRIRVASVGTAVVLVPAFWLAMRLLPASILTPRNLDVLRVGMATTACLPIIAWYAMNYVALIAANRRQYVVLSNLACGVPALVAMALFGALASQWEAVMLTTLAVLSGAELIEGLVLGVLVRRVLPVVGTPPSGVAAA